jgi:hypothetical protein
LGFSLAWHSKVHHKFFVIPPAASDTAWHLAGTSLPFCGFSSNLVLPRFCRFAAFSFSPTFASRTFSYRPSAVVSVQTHSEETLKTNEV